MNNERIERIIFYFLIFTIFLNFILPGEIYFISRYLTIFIHITLFFIFLINRLQQDKQKAIIIPWKGLFSTIIILFAISSFASVNYHRSRDLLFLFLNYALIFIIIQNIRISRQNTDFFYHGIFVVSLTIIMYGLYQYFIGFDYLLEKLKDINNIDPTMLADMKKRITDRRIFSTFALPTSLAGYLALVLPLAIAKLYFSWRYKRKQLYYYIPLVLLMFSAMILTGSFGAIVSLIVAVIIVCFLLFYKRSEFKRFIFYIIALALILALSLLLLTHFRGFTLWNLKAPTNPIVLRLDNWKVALKIAQDYPYFGAGLGNYGTLYPKYMTIEKSMTQFAHNSLLQFAGELGWITTILIVIMFLVFMVKPIRYVKQGTNLTETKNQSFIFYALLISCLTFVLHNFIEIGIYFHSLGLFGIFLFSHLIKANQQKTIEKKGEKPISHSRKILHSWIALFLFIAVSAWITRPLVAYIYAQDALEKAELKDYQNSINLISVAIFWDSVNSEYYIARAKMRLATERKTPDELAYAINDYQNAIQLNPITPHLHFELSELYLSNGWYTHAYLEAYEAAQLYPLNKKYADHLIMYRRFMEHSKIERNN